jgi:ATP-binding cassette subfamily B protein
MHKGKIRESGSHQNLIEKGGGIYRKLYELQYKDQAAEIADVVN